MQFDVNTLFSLLLIQALMLAIMLPALMGWRAVSQAAKVVQAAAVLQSLGWMGIVLAGQWPGRWAYGGALLCLSAGFSALWWALQTWVGQRPGRWLMMGLPVLMPAVYVIAYDYPGFRMLWANGLLAVQLGLICLALAWPAKHLERSSRRWRTLLLLALLAVGALTAWRAVLGLQSPDVELQLHSSHPLNISAAILSHVALLACAMSVLVAWRAETESTLKRLTHTDAQTGLCNRRSFTARSVDMISMARRHNEPLAAMKLDLDNFKAVNVEHGEEAGDKAIALFGACLIQEMRLGDLGARVGGQEFAVVMARCDAQGPQALDQRMRKALAERAPKELGFALSFSAGWAKLRPGDRSIEDLMPRAAAALYAAKEAGKGRLCAEPGLEE
ncbi:GGDEF domain-containing protein [Pelomonas sp. SE-A7]|uniref:GGDEF domain-containing protein n=1 Tax=Pelomonas sp. SE-A7 TaxID=3054953 RepID=UPI00259C9D1A|nr:GGDEF domain-containing protein [Pelomonas sp. SE-A7]MDM4767946.1 GGDEF domain-containing protein [Pelomonas sp. SE-A7]